MRVLFKIIIIIFFIFILSNEINRNQGNKKLSIKEYYKFKLYLLIAPYTVWCIFNSYEINTSFPSMKINFPNHNLLKDNWTHIRDEAINIYNSGNTSIIKNDMFFKNIADDKWKRFYIKWYGPITNEAYKLCPITCKLIEQLPEIKLAMFSILEPGSKITPHAGPFKGCIRYHLGLNCPEESFIIVDGIRYTWKNGEDVLFDDTFIHEVKNESNDTRIILFCDIERKMKEPISTFIDKLIINLIAPLTNRSNKKQEKITKI
jgi:beta-hydroxylase